jgi:hypothetical protein
MISPALLLQRICVKHCFLDSCRPELGCWQPSHGCGGVAAGVARDFLNVHGHFLAIGGDFPDVTGDFLTVIPISRLSAAVARM